MSSHPSDQMSLGSLGHSVVLWRLWLLVLTEQASKGRTRSPIELFWTAKKGPRFSKMLMVRVITYERPAPRVHSCTRPCVTGHICAQPLGLSLPRQNAFAQLSTEGTAKQLMLKTSPSNNEQTPPQTKRHMPSLLFTPHYSNFYQQIIFITIQFVSLNNFVNKSEHERKTSSPQHSRCSYSSGALIRIYFHPETAEK